MMPAQIQVGTPLHTYITTNPRFRQELSEREQQWYLQLVADAIQSVEEGVGPLEDMGYSGWRAGRLPHAFPYSSARNTPRNEDLDRAVGTGYAAYGGRAEFWRNFSLILKGTPERRFYRPKSKWTMYDNPIGPSKPLGIVRIPLESH